MKCPSDSHADRIKAGETPESGAGSYNGVLPLHAVFKTCDLSAFVSTSTDCPLK